MHLKKGEEQPSSIGKVECDKMVRINRERTRMAKNGEN